MQPLRKICCIWETIPNEEGSRYGSFKGGEFYYSIDMGADNQSDVNRREDWSKIDWFFVHGWIASGISLILLRFGFHIVKSTHQEIRNRRFYR
ncbi:hypothetical protein LEP1GSC075_0225 [Leptospira interrogans str. Kito]|nr:hypothetical protein LEP1GSC069_3660 [Leptospira interrogans serovar Canicola str. Fiocruz LV133]EMK19717.1 hypothetical protein LEP1GSC075_0225 [Leptospira interrogans str. Kito]EMN75740.1 hypothetical protein LEP1GSC102_1136 [Leptospira interrogans str. UI 09600]